MLLEDGQQHRLDRDRALAARLAAFEIPCFPYPYRGAGIRTRDLLLPKQAPPEPIYAKLLIFKGRLPCPAASRSPFAGVCRVQSGT
jgi:hypothetical protein